MFALLLWGLNVHQSVLLRKLEDVEAEWRENLKNNMLDNASDYIILISYAYFNHSDSTVVLNSSSSDKTTS